MTKKVMNVSFVLFTFFTNLIYPSLKMTSRICPEFFHVRNLSGSNFLCPEFVQVYLSRICPEFFMLGICLVYLSRIYPEFFMFGICSEFIWYLSWFIVQNLSRIFILDKYWTNTGQILDEAKFRTLDLCQKNGQFLDDFRIFWTISGHFWWQFPDTYFS